VSAVKTILSCFLKVLLLFQTVSVQAQQGIDEREVGAKGSIPFQLSAGFLIVVEGRIGDLKGLRFVLDTGATYSVVARKVADKFSLTRSKDRLFNFDKYAQVERAEFPEVQFGPIEVRNASLMVDDLGKSSELAKDMDAVIGLDLLSMSKRFRIDYVARRVLLQTAGGARHGDLRQEKPKCFVVQVLVHGGPVRLVVDTGMEGILLYEDRVRKQVPRLRLLNEINGVRAGRLQMKRAKLPGVDWGNGEKEPRFI
jgi:predicted aspartyl protease